MIQIDVLKGLDIFQGLADDECAAVAAIMKESRFAARDVIFREGEPGDAAYLVVDGAVSITALTAGDRSREITMVRAGSVFGEMALVDPGARSATVTAAEPTLLLRLLRREFFELAATERSIGIKVLLNLGILLTDRLRNANESHRAVVEPKAEAEPDTSALDFYQLMRDRATIEVELMTGRRLTGTLVKVEKSPPGHELTLRDEDGRIHVVPHHAIAVVHADVRARDPGGCA